MNFCWIARSRIGSAPRQRATEPYVRFAMSAANRSTFSTLIGARTAPLQSLGGIDTSRPYYDTEIDRVLINKSKPWPQKLRGFPNHRANLNCTFVDDFRWQIVASRSSALYITKVGSNLIQFDFGQKRSTCITAHLPTTSSSFRNLPKRRS